jgi:hypothetical protein
VSVCEEVDDIASGCEPYGPAYECKDGVRRCYECEVRFGQKFVPKDHVLGSDDPDGDAVAMYFAHNDTAKVQA